MFKFRSLAIVSLTVLLSNVGYAKPANPKKPQPVATQVKKEEQKEEEPKKQESSALSFDFTGISVKESEREGLNKFMAVICSQKSVVIKLFLKVEEADLSTESLRKKFMESEIFEGLSSAEKEDMIAFAKGPFFELGVDKIIMDCCAALNSDDIKNKIKKVHNLGSDPKTKTLLNIVKSLMLGNKLSDKNRDLALYGLKMISYVLARSHMEAVLKEANIAIPERTVKKKLEDNKEDNKEEKKDTDSNTATVPAAAAA